MSLKNEFSVYVLDDEPDILELIETTFSQKGFKVKTFSSIKEIQASLELSLPDILILDLVLGADNTISLIEEVQDKYPQVDLYIVSGYLNKEFKNKLASLNIKNILSKPFEIQDYVQDFYHRYL